MKNQTVKKNLTNPSGLNFAFSDGGAIEAIEKDPVRINILMGSSLTSGFTNIYLRKRTSELEAVPLIGPKAPGSFLLTESDFIAYGNWSGIQYRCRLLLSEENNWYWDVHLENQSDEKVELDLIFTQDVGMAPVTAESFMLNMYYVSQYVDRAVLEDEGQGKVVCCRQNAHGPACFPWLMIGSTGSAKSACTDAYQFYGTGYRATGILSALDLEELPEPRIQELSFIALQEKPFSLDPSEKRQTGFFTAFVQDHPEATSSKDLAIIKPALEEYESLKAQPIPELPETEKPADNLFVSSPYLSAENLSDDELDKFFTKERRHLEVNDGRPLSFFYGDHQHVVLREKELLTERPHGHLMQTGDKFYPDESIATTTAYMSGVFNSHITQGNTNYNILLSMCVDSLNLARHTGERIFVKVGEEYQLLGTPSAFEIGLNSCRWVYKAGSLLIEVRTWTAPKHPEINLDVNILKGDEAELLISNEILPGLFRIAETAGDRSEVRFVPADGSETAKQFPDGYFTMRFNKPDEISDIGGDELLFKDNVRRSESFCVIATKPVKSFSLQIMGEMLEPVSTIITDITPEERWERDCNDAVNTWKNISSDLNLQNPPDTVLPGIEEIREILPWYYHNCSVHYLTPHGLEQYMNAAWGSRDICQGPLELLLCFERFAEARNVLEIMFSHQNPDGNWPQWWMFDRYHSIRSGEAHGDIVFWPILALNEYIIATGDTAFLDEEFPFYHNSDPTTLAEHVERSIGMIKSRLVGETALIDYGEGDWNDSMQPADHELKHRLISAWTVCLSYQTLTGYANICRHAGREAYADELSELCEKIKADFNRFLVKDGIVSGFGLVEDDDEIKLLLHPSDTTTGISYRLLPMIRGIISGIFSPEQAEAHLKIIEQHLKGPDGARLMDCPPKYRGGLQKYFQRAESSPFFGREIGLMYMHAHLRYTEAQARAGKADAFFKALRQAIPVNIREIVPTADIRQSNCYYSSSDADFPDRYEADEKYDDVKAGKIKLKGGWRIYSSGPGIYVRLVVSRLFGIRRSFEGTILDPVISSELNGLTVNMQFRGRDVNFIYNVTGSGAGPEKIEINGENVHFEREANAYRPGGAILDDAVLEKALNKPQNAIKIYL